VLPLGSCSVPCRRALRETPRLHPATPDEIAESLSFALRYEGHNRVHHADDMMARIMADRLVRRSERSRLVVMKQPAGPDLTTSRMPMPGQD